MMWSHPVITPGMVRDWIGRDLSNEDWIRLIQAIPQSTVPEAIQTIVFEALEVPYPEEELDGA